MRKKTSLAKAITADEENKPRGRHRRHRIGNELRYTGLAAEMRTTKAPATAVLFRLL